MGGEINLHWESWDIVSLQGTQRNYKVDEWGGSIGGMHF